MPGAGLLGAGEPGATPPLVASVVFLGVVVSGVTAVLPRTAGGMPACGLQRSREGGWSSWGSKPGTLVCSTGC